MKEHPERTKEMRQKTVAKHRDKIRQKASEYKRNHPEKVARNNHIRRARLSNATGQFTSQEWQNLCNHYKCICLACGREVKLTVDHVIPLSKNGTNDIDNIQPLCRSCNARKHANDIDYRPSFDITIDTLGVAYQRIGSGDIPNNWQEVPVWEHVNSALRYFEDYLTNGKHVDSLTNGVYFTMMALAMELRNKDT